MVNDYGGHYLVVGPAPKPIEGTWDSSGFVVIEFPDVDRIRQGTTLPSTGGPVRSERTRRG
ncbi:DUF1330 domain-containing protein [Herbiconiux ginsengi]|uniref:DUF1330 domain-containing protein n=1 Tax=Herbiconiux ginsengi TaxID=381665 RepID=UPI0038990F57